MVNSIICYYINHCHQLIVSIIFKISYRLILLPCLINLICCSIDKIKCSSKPGKRLNQPFLPIEGDSGSGQHFLWAIVIVATILLVFLSICFCRCYYRYNEICDEKHSQFDYPFDHHLYAGSSACQTPTPSTSPITVPQSIQLASSNVSQHQIKIYAHANERCKDKNEQEQSQQLSTIVLHGQSSFKIHANPAKHDSKTRRQSSFRSSL